MDYPGKFTAYWCAVTTAAEQAKINKFNALYSVLKAKLRYGIGPMFHSVFELSQIHASKWPDYLVDAPLRIALRQVNPKQHRIVIDNKILFWLHCQHQQLRTIDIYNRGADMATLSAADFIKVVPASCQALFIKQVGGFGGEGAFIATRVHDIWHFQGLTGSLAALYQYCQHHCVSGYGWIIQPKLSSHPIINAISGKDGLSTLRLVSHRQGNCVKLAYAVIKLASAGNITDNFKHGITGNMVAAIDLVTGKLRAAKGSLRRSWPAITSLSHCPCSGNPIEGVALPYWPETVALITRAHLSVENLPSLGWDLAITANGPVLVEGNTNYGVDLLQVAYGRGLRQELLAELQNLLTMQNGH